MSTKNLTKAFSRITLNESIQDPNGIPCPTLDNPHGSEDSSMHTKTGQMLTKVPESIHSYLSLLFLDPFWYEKYLLEPGVMDLLLRSQTQDPFTECTDYDTVVLEWIARESAFQSFSYVEGYFVDVWLSPLEDIIKSPLYDHDLLL